MRIARAPLPALRPFVKTVWAVAPSAPSPTAGPVAHENVLPTGGMHLVFRLSGPPLRLYDGDREGHVLGHAVVGGARAAFYVRDISQPARSVGVQFHPGAAPLLLGVPASELAERHTRLEDLWGSRATEWHDRLAAARSLAAQAATLEAMLVTRLPSVRGVHPAVAEALAQLHAGSYVAAAARDSGRSHRSFIRLFRDAVGLPPKRYARVVRFQHAVALVSTTSASLARVALDSGYADQAHLTREFRELAGVAPRAYRRMAPDQPNHVRVR